MRRLGGRRHISVATPNRREEGSALIVGQLQRGCQEVHDGEVGLLRLAAFSRSDGFRRYACLFGQLFLRQARLLPVVPQGIAKRCQSCIAGASCAYGCPHAQSHARRARLAVLFL